MIKLTIRWLFILLLVAFLFVMRRMNMLYRAQNLFLILLILTSALTVLGVVLFRDGVMASDDEIDPKPEAAALLKKIEEEEATN